MLKPVINVQTYQDESGDWRWRSSVIEPQPGGEKGEVIAISEHGYKDKKDMLTAFFGIYFGSYDESFLTMYAEWMPPSITAADLNNDAAQSQA